MGRIDSLEKGLSRHAEENIQLWAAIGSIKQSLFNADIIKPCCLGVLNKTFNIDGMKDLFCRYCPKCGKEIPHSDIFKKHHKLTPNTKEDRHETEPGSQIKERYNNLI